MLNARFFLLIAIALVYLVAVPGTSLIRAAISGDALTLRLSFGTPMLWLTTAVIVLIIFGLWKRFAWAWWLGIAAAGFQLVRMGLWVSQHYSLSRLPGEGTLLVLGLLVSFLVLMLLPGTRMACRR
ncbi:hypothetical protein O4G98_16090 [Zoogloeaceae bacterium G21618-S1]|nr:hypothetical protein [Zoogloeaceae bacterium G21618-S1]